MGNESEAGAEHDDDAGSDWDNAAGEEFRAAAKHAAAGLAALFSRGEAARFAKRSVEMVEPVVRTAVDSMQHDAGQFVAAAEPSLRDAWASMKRTIQQTTSNESTLQDAAQSVFEDAKTAFNELRNRQENDDTTDGEQP